MLTVKAREAELPFGAVAVTAVQPGELGNIEFGTRTGRRRERNAAVAQVKMVNLTQKNIADTTGLDAVAFIGLATERGV